MGRAFKPKKVQELAGAYKDHPRRAAERAAEPEPVGELGAAPSYLSDAEKKIWRETRKNVYWLDHNDRTTVELMCKLAAKMRANELNIPDYPKLLNALSRLGMTPVDRPRVQAPPKKKEKQDEWADFALPSPETHTTQ